MDQPPTDISAYHIRVFLESICNFRCVYCNPDADHQGRHVLSDGELFDTLTAAAALGIRRIHYSGGEPTLRKTLPDILRHARTCGFREQVITTNGQLLASRFNEYYSAGLTRANISIDSLDRERFAQITGRDALDAVLSAIDKARGAFGRVKLNFVVLRDNLHEIPDFVRLSAAHAGQVIVRFIELQSNQPVFFQAERIADQHVGLAMIETMIKSVGEMTPTTVNGENPNCLYYRVGEAGAVIGIIANHSRGYPCGGCRKLRLSPYGDLGACITAEGVNIRGTNVAQKTEALQEQLRRRDELDRIQPFRKHHSTAFGFWRWGDVSVAKTGRAAPVNIEQFKR